jgi:hypothetical protein
LGFGAFFGSFLPLSLLPMGASVTQKGRWGKVEKPMSHGLCCLARRIDPLAAGPISTHDDCPAIAYEDRI